MFDRTYGTRIEVWEGHARFTRGKLEKADLLKNKYGKIVSKKKSELAKKKDTVSRLKQFRFKTKE
mgnify:CR=1 FL=1|jgi:hypothetical protein